MLWYFILFTASPKIELIEELEMKIFSMLLVSFLLSLSSYARSCPSSKIAAWYVSSPEDINILENKQFNLFFL